MGAGDGVTVHEQVTVVATRKPKEGEKRTRKEDVEVDFPNPISFRLKVVGETYETRKITVNITEYYHRGSKLFEKGWMSKEAYELTKIKWDEGQVMMPYTDNDGAAEDFFERLIGTDGDVEEAKAFEVNGVKMGVGQTGRNWNGLQVNHAGYLTGAAYNEIKYLESGLNFRSATRFLSTLSRLMMTGARNRYRALSNIENPRLRNIVNQIWRKGAKIGNGSTMDIFRFDGSHRQKLIDNFNGLSNLLKNHRTGRSLLNSKDLNFTKKIMIDIVNALRGK